MEAILYFIRDELSGTHYFIYAFICFIFLFAIVGYLFKQKYAKVEFKLSSSQPTPVEPSKKELKKAAREAKKKGKNKGVVATTTIQSANTVAPSVLPSQASPQPVQQATSIPSTPVKLTQTQSASTPQNTQVAQPNAQSVQATGGLQQPTSLPNINQTIPTNQSSDGIPEIIE